MTLGIKLASTTAILLTLVACGGSSSSNSSADVSRVITGEDALNIGTTSTNASANGLPFASLDFDPDAPLPPATVRLIRFVSDNVTGETSLIVTEETITLDPLEEDEEPDGISGTLTFNGNVIRFVDGEGVLPDGTTIRIFENVSGEWSTVVSPYSYVYDDDEETTKAPGINTEGSFAVGLQTNPNDMPTDSGSTIYVGDFSGYSTLLDLEGAVLANEVEINGQTTLDVQFADSLISGILEFSTDGVEGEDIDSNVFATLAIAETDIVGNGFASTANVVNSCGGLNCTSTTQIGGAFFGPEAEELTGVAGIDFSQEDLEGGGVRLVGAGGFITTPQSSE